MTTNRTKLARRMRKERGRRVQQAKNEYLSLVVMGVVSAEMFRLAEHAIRPHTHDEKYDYYRRLIHAANKTV